MWPTVSEQLKLDFEDEVDRRTIAPVRPTDSLPGQPEFSIERLPTDLQDRFRSLYQSSAEEGEYLAVNEIYQGDARDLLPRIRPNSIALSVWSPPYFVGKEYEAYLSFEDWQRLLAEVIRLHFSHHHTWRFSGQQSGWRVEMRPVGRKSFASD